MHHLVHIRAFIFKIRINVPWNWFPRCLAFGVAVRVRLWTAFRIVNSSAWNSNILKFKQRPKCLLGHSNGNDGRRTIQNMPRRFELYELSFKYLECDLSPGLLGSWAGSCRRWPRPQTPTDRWAWHSKPVFEKNTNHTWNQTPREGGRLSNGYRCNMERDGCIDIQV